MTTSEEEIDDAQKAVQQGFLNRVAGASASVTVYLTNGVKLQGNLTKHDDVCILLDRRNQSQLVYKHAISTILPDEAVSLSSSGSSSE